MSDQKDLNQEAKALLNSLNKEIDKNVPLSEEPKAPQEKQQQADQPQPQQKRQVDPNPERKEPLQYPINLLAVYLKDMSFESPNSPGVFNAKWDPQVDLKLNNKNRRVEEQTYEAVLHITISCKQEKGFAFFIEIQQAGLFQINGLDKEQTQQILSTYCAEILFPYARSMVDNILIQGGFPPLKLAPINFMQVYQDSLKKENRDKK